MVFNQKLVCLEKFLSNFPGRSQQVWTHLHWEKKYLTLLQMSFRKRKLLLVIRASCRKLCPGVFIHLWLLPSHLRKYLSLTIFVLGFIWWWNYQSLFYILSCPLFSFKLVKVVSGWLHCCGSRITEWHQPLKQSWPPAKWKLFLFSSLRCSLVAFSCLIRRNLCPFSSYVFGKVGDISKDMETFVYKFIKQIWYLVLTADNYCMFNPQYA